MVGAILTVRIQELRRRFRLAVPVLACCSMPNLQQWEEIDRVSCL